MSATNDLTQKILNDLFLRRIYAWRNSVGFLPTNHGMYQMGKIGSSDIIAILPPVGRFLGIEIKTGKDRIRPEQEGFKRNLELMGALYIIVHDFENYLSTLDSILKTPHTLSTVSGLG